MYNLDDGEIFYHGIPILGPKYDLIIGEDYIKYLAKKFDLMPCLSVDENVGNFLSNIYKAKKKPSFLSKGSSIMISWPALIVDCVAFLGKRYIFFLFAVFFFDKIP